MPRLNLGFLASHGGSNMQAIIDACKAGRLDAVPAVVISNNADSTALERARKESVPWYHLSSATHPDPGALDDEMLRVAREHEVDLMVLAGYMKKIGPKTLAAYRGRMVNVHPALLPKHGGKGMWGKHVHESVLKSGDKITGVTIHLVEGEYDTGPILAQREVEVKPGDDVETLAARVLEQEHKLFPETLQRIATGNLKLPASGAPPGTLSGRS